MVDYKTKDTITFYYDSNELFSDISHLSAYMTKSYAASTNTQMDELYLSEDERDVYDVCLSQIFPKVYEPMIKMASGIGGAFMENFFVDDTDADPLHRKPGAYIELTIHNNSTHDFNTFNFNTMSILDASIRDSLKYGILSEFYATNLCNELHQIALGKFMDHLSTLRDKLFQLKRKYVPTHLIIDIQPI